MPARILSIMNTGFRVSDMGDDFSFSGLERDLIACISLR